MADTKISGMGAATTLSLTNTVPIVQSGVNKQATLGQLKAIANVPLIGTGGPGILSLSFEILNISGACNLPIGTDGTKITLVATGSGTVNGTGISYLYVAGDTLSVLWLNSKWNVLSVYNMTVV